jgi:hypothetical protein
MGSVTFEPAGIACLQHVVFRPPPAQRLVSDTFMLHYSYTQVGRIRRLKSKDPDNVSGSVLMRENHSRGSGRLAVAAPLRSLASRFGAPAECLGRKPAEKLFRVACSPQFCFDFVDRSRIDAGVEMPERLGTARGRANCELFLTPPNCDQPCRSRMVKLAPVVRALGMAGVGHLDHMIVVVDDSIGEDPFPGWNCRR